MGLFKEAQEVICKQLKLDPEKVKPEATLIDDFGVDSLDSEVYNK